MSVGTSEAAAGELNPEGIADRTTVGVFFSQAARYGDRPLVHYKVGDTWKAQTWADMKRDVLAHLLLKNLELLPQQHSQDLRVFEAHPQITYPYRRQSPRLACRLHRKRQNRAELTF